MHNFFIIFIFSYLQRLRQHRNLRLYCVISGKLSSPKKFILLIDKAMCLKNSHKKILPKWINFLTILIPENTAKFKLFKRKIIYTLSTEMG